MTILAVAALGQMLVVMQAGIDLSTPGVISLGGNFIVGVSVGSNHRLALGILACIGLGAMRRPRQRSPRRRREAEPADRHAGRRADRLRVEPEVLARRHELVSGAGSALVVGGREATRHQRRLLDGRRDHGRRRARASLHGLRAALSGSGRESESRVDGRAARPNARRLRVHGGGNPLRGCGGPARRHPHQRRPGLRRRLPARADRRSRHCRRVAFRRAGKRNVDVGGGARAHLLDADVADPGSVGGDAVHRLRCRDHRGDAGLRRPGRLACSAGVLRPVEATAGNHPQVDRNTS